MSEPVQVGCRDLATEAAQIGEPHIIHDNEQDIGLRVSGASRRRRVTDGAGRAQRCQEKKAADPEVHVDRQISRSWCAARSPS